MAEHLQFKAKAFGTAKEHLEDKVYHVLEEVGLEKFSDRLSGNLSKGQKQRVMLAAAILQEADLIIFDEPTVGLDIPSKQWLAHWIKKNAMDKRSILISSHSLDFVIETTYRVILIEQGELKSSKPVPKGKAELQAWCNGIIEELGEFWIAMNNIISLQLLHTYRTFTDVTTSKSRLWTPLLLFLLLWVFIFI
ncbi:ATP-binding cassette domain-containing protein [Paenibacillus larvae]|nr:ATP-binding cassette domain-containing protein [Paenibacillus larvae]MDT2274455.1 ATP-binding cassette domain-containing protein [Paenibacillus larvae]